MATIRATTARPLDDELDVDFEGAGSSAAVNCITGAGCSASGAVSIHDTTVPSS